jgi:hypothetical protein
MPAEMALGFEMFEIWYDPFPPEMVTASLPPAAREILFWLKASPDVEEVFGEFTVTESVPQVFDVSQTEIVAPPAARPVTVTCVPERFVETTLVLVLLCMVYVPFPPETVTDWFPPTESERLLGLNEMFDDTVVACTVTASVVQSEAVPTPQTLTDVEPSDEPVTVTCVPFIETDATVGLEFNPK